MICFIVCLWDTIKDGYRDDGEEYNDLLSKLHDIDVTNIIEMDDITDLKGELACASGGCEVK